MSKVDLEVTNLRLVVNAFRNSVVMLGDRGFDISDLLKVTDQQLEKGFEEQKLIWKVDHLDDENLECFLVMEDPGIIFRSDNMASAMKNVLSRRTEEKMTHVILIFTNPKPTYIEKKINQINRKTDKILKLGLKGQPYLRFQHFSYLEQQTNKTRHELVPLHVKLTEEQKNKVIERLGLGENAMEAFPCILENDPQARWLGLRPGDMCMIVRNSPTVGRAKIFRVCIPKPS